MNRKKFLSPLLVAAVCLLAVGCSSKKADKKTDENAAIEKVEVIEIKEQKINRTVEYPSTLAPFEELYLTSASPGRIEKIFVEIGSRVAKGQQLVQMDRTSLYQSEVQLQNVATDFKRMDTLNKAGSISKQAYDQVKTQYEVLKSSVDYLSQNTKLVAPFSGIVSGKYFENGEMYSGAPNTSAGKAAILSLVQIDNLKAFVSIPESFFPLIKNGMDVKVTCDIYPNQSFKGQIFRIHPTIDASSHTFQTEVKVINSKEQLRPGMYTKVTFELGETMALVAPAYAVLKLQGSNDRYVFIEKEGKAKRMNVTLGKRYDDMVEIISNEVKQGDKLIVSGQSRLFDDVPVEVVTSPSKK